MLLSGAFILGGYVLVGVMIFLGILKNLFFERNRKGRRKLIVEKALALIAWLILLVMILAS